MARRPGIATRADGRIGDIEGSAMGVQLVLIEDATVQVPLHCSDPQPRIRLVPNMYPMQNHQNCMKIPLPKPKLKQMIHPLTKYSNVMQITPSVQLLTKLFEFERTLPVARWGL